MTRLNELNTELTRMAPGVMAGSADSENLIAKGHKLRAESMAGMVGQAFAAIGRARRRRRTINELKKLSDRMLDDIGLRYGQIEEVATILAARPAVETTQGVTPMVHSFLAKARQARLRRATIRELEHLSDRILADIGISRSQIPAAVDGILEKRRVQAPAGKSAGSPVHELLIRLEDTIRPLRQWHLSRLAAGQIARLGNDTLSDLGYVKGDVDWVPEVMAEKKIANTSNRPQAGAA